MTMSNEIQTNETFEEKLKTRIRESIGDLLSDDDLKKIIDRGLEEVFFTEKVTITGHYSNNKQITPPLIHQMIKELLQPNVDEIIKQYIHEHETEVNEIIHNTVQEGIGTCLVKAMNSMFQHQMFTLENNIRNQIANR
jgi:hypothetical protein